MLFILTIIIIRSYFTFNYLLFYHNTDLTNIRCYSIVLVITRIHVCLYLLTLPLAWLMLPRVISHSSLRSSGTRAQPRGHVPRRFRLAALRARVHLRRVGKHVPVQHGRGREDLLRDRVRAEMQSERERHVELPFLERKDGEARGRARVLEREEKFRPVDERQIRGRATVRDQVQREGHRESGRVEGHSQVEVGRDEGDRKSAQRWLRVGQRPRSVRRHGELERRLLRGGGEGVEGWIRGGERRRGVGDRVGARTGRRSAFEQGKRSDREGETAEKMPEQEDLLLWKSPRFQLW